MYITFRHNNVEFINYDINSKEFIDLEIPESVKATAIQKANFDLVTKKRQAAYKAESDPLYMEAQFDGTPESHQKWQDKVAEIKARYPLPQSTAENA